MTSMISAETLLWYALLVMRQNNCAIMFRAVVEDIYPQ